MSVLEECLINKNVFEMIFDERSITMMFNKVSAITSVNLLRVYKCCRSIYKNESIIPFSKFYEDASYENIDELIAPTTDFSFIKVLETLRDIRDHQGKYKVHNGEVSFRITGIDHYYDDFNNSEGDSNKLWMVKMYYERI